MTIAFFEISKFEKQKFLEAFPKFNLLFFENTIQDVDIEEYKTADVISVFIHSQVTKEILSNLKNLKLVTTRSTGMDHIDIDYCNEKNIQIKNVPFYGETTVAEHTFALILALSRKIHSSYIRSLNGSFSTIGLTGFDLQDKTLGIIGGGRIGLHVARIAKGFGMHVRVFDINEDNFLAELINFKYVSLDELYKNSDIVSLHVPLNKHTNHMINKDSLSKFKKGALLINTARGGLVNTDDLIKAIDNKTISRSGS